MEEILNEFTQTLLQVAATVLVGLACNGIRHLSAWLINKTCSEKLKQAVEELERITVDGIMYTEQTFVKQAKTETWDSEVQRDALVNCVDYVLRNLSVSTQTILTENEDELIDLIERKIEANIGKLHLN